MSQIKYLLIFIYCKNAVLRRTEGAENHVWISVYRQRRSSRRPIESRWDRLSFQVCLPNAVSAAI